MHVQSALRRHTQNLSPAAHRLVCLVIVALEMGALGDIPFGLLAWSHLVFPPGDDEDSFWRSLTAGDKKGVMAAARDPGKDKEVCHHEGLRGA